MIPSPLLVVTDRHGSPRPLVETVRAALDGGARWIWLRDKDLERGARRDLALQLFDLVRAAGGRLTVGGDAALATEIGADGVHLGIEEFARMRAETSPRPQEQSVITSVCEAVHSRRTHGRSSTLYGFADARDDGGETAGFGDARVTKAGRAPSLTGVSAHGLDDVRRASTADADYATLSPIFLSASKPGYGPALGLGPLREASALGLPVIALGGIAPDNAAACREAGAAGVAVMGAIMGAADPVAATRRFVEALGGAT